LLISGAWFVYARDNPQEHKAVGTAELRLIGEDRPHSNARSGGTPRRRLVRSRSIWFLALSCGVAGFPSYVFYTWFFLSLANVRKVDLVSGGYWSALPYIAMAMLTPAGGRISDRLTDRFGKRWGRLSAVWIGSSLATALILRGARIAVPEAAIVCLALAAGFHLFSQPPSWAATIDLAPEHSATVFGLMNTFAQGIGAAAPVVTPWIAERFGWISALDATAAMALLAGCLWFFVHPERPLV
jgi:ACS family glucarate transporter-like MFS transporter